MTIIALVRCLEKIEGRNRTGRINCVCNRGAYPDEVVAGAISDWRTWEADGLANRRSDTFVLLPPVFNAAEWSLVLKLRMATSSPNRRHAAVF